MELLRDDFDASEGEENDFGDDELYLYRRSGPSGGRDKPESRRIIIMTHNGIGKT